MKINKDLYSHRKHLSMDNRVRFLSVLNRGLPQIAGIVNKNPSEAMIKANLK